MPSHHAYITYKLCSEYYLEKTYIVIPIIGLNTNYKCLFLFVIRYFYLNNKNKMFLKYIPSKLRSSYIEDGD